MYYDYYEEERPENCINCTNICTNVEYIITMLRDQKTVMSNEREIYYEDVEEKPESCTNICTP